MRGTAGCPSGPTTSGASTAQSSLAASQACSESGQVTDQYCFSTKATPVGIEVERLEGLEAAEVLWQLCQAVLAQVQLGDVGEEGEVGRQTDKENYVYLCCSH